MQDIHSIPGAGATFFSASGNPTLRPNQNNHHNHQPLNCPRCDSINTKFCYYNNYNLSQPRHFCKNCRRYWTNGGVLRNVPVGGGNRKSKRSTKPKNSPSSETTDLPNTPPELENKSNSHSSSESSSLTAAAVTETVSEQTNPISKTLIHVNQTNTGLEENDSLQQGTDDCGGTIFSEIANFTSLISSSNETLPFEFVNCNSNRHGNGNGLTDASSFQWQQQKVVTVTGDQPYRHEEALKLLPDNVGAGGGGSLLDHGAGNNGGFGSLDWQGGADQGLFYISNTVDHGYWNHTHWSDQDNSTLFPLP